MKKSTIWILAAIMAIAFFGLLYLQINYLRGSIEMRKDIFNDAVSRSLQQVARELEIDEAKKNIEEAYVESRKKENAYQRALNLNRQQEIIQQERVKVRAPGMDLQMEHNIVTTVRTKQPQQVFQSPQGGTNAISKSFFDLQEEQKNIYLYKRGVFDEALERTMKSANNLPIEERINFKDLENNIRNQIRYNSIELPFLYAVVDKNNQLIRGQENIVNKGNADVYSIPLFSNDPSDKMSYFLLVNFPDKQKYLFSEVSFLYPAIFFTLILLVSFIIMLYITFRQKRLSEMKSDFMNNMTHELKTPVSTISLAAQMLKDGSITKSPEVFKHISGVINDETERLSFQVEKVLQMSLFEKQRATLKMKELDVNDVVVTVANTFQLKVEKFGGNLDIDLEATESTIEADKMHFTNVLFNLLDNAVKYRKEDIPLELMIRTWNNNNKLYISVEDNGLGIKKEYVKKIFERFYRVSTGNRHDVKGFGLGLAYVKKIVEDHKGTIKAESELGKGTKFIICLPIMKIKD